MKRLVHKQSCFKVYSLSDRKPVQRPEHWTNVVVFPCSSQDLSSKGITHLRYLFQNHQLMTFNTLVQWFGVDREQFLQHQLLKDTIRSYQNLYCHYTKSTAKLYAVPFSAKRAKKTFFSYVQILKKRIINKQTSIKYVCVYLFILAQKRWKEKKYQVVALSLRNSWKCSCLSLLFY